MNPYQSLPSRSFWRTAVAELDPLAIGDLWQPAFRIEQDDPVLTAGSCFAAHLGRRLLEHGMNWRDTEPAPPGLTAAERQARRYGEFSFRTGTIYTAALLRQWLAWAYGESSPPLSAWPHEDRYCDPFRPAVEPEGFADPDSMLAARAATFAAIRTGIAEASCLIFTLGLTEAWRDRIDGTVYPVCPGTVRGRFDPQRHEFCNFTAAQVHQDLRAAIGLARAANPRLRVLLTVSPVPLTATATGGHALTATTYSKSVLRAVAGELAQQDADVDYFPAYELITGFPFGAGFFEPNLRTVTPRGVSWVMEHFFQAWGAQRDGSAPPTTDPANQPDLAASGAEDIYCDDAILDYYHSR